MPGFGRAGVLMGTFFFFYPFLEFIAWWGVISYFGWEAAFWIGLLSTIMGFWVLRVTGSAASAEMQKTLQGGQMPTKKVLHHLVIGFAGFLLILPGF